MLSVNECILQPEQVMVVVLVEFRIELAKVSKLLILNATGSY